MQLTISVKINVMENQNTLMGELILVLKESLRKQAFSVILLVIACGGLWIMRDQDKADFRDEILQLKSDLHHCMESRESQSVRIATLEASISILQTRR